MRSGSVVTPLCVVLFLALVPSLTPAEESEDKDTSVERICAHYDELTKECEPLDKQLDDCYFHRQGGSIWDCESIRLQYGACRDRAEAFYAKWGQVIDLCRKNDGASPRSTPPRKMGISPARAEKIIQDEAGKLPQGVKVESARCRRNGSSETECSIVFRDLSTGGLFGPAQGGGATDQFYQAVQRRFSRESKPRPFDAKLRTHPCETATGLNRTAGRPSEDGRGSPRDGEWASADSDKDGKYESASRTNPDGSKTLLIDTDGDGRVDHEVNIDPSGVPVYSKPSETGFVVDLSRPPEEVTRADAEVRWHEWLEKQPAIKGDDGYIEVIRPTGFGASGPPSGQRNYFVNGVLNSPAEAADSARALADVLNAPVAAVYSGSAKATGHPIPVLPDAWNAVTGQDLWSGRAALASGMFLDLMGGTAVTVFAHSRGAAVTYDAVQDLGKLLDSAGKGSLMHNLTVVTVGGFSPPPSGWPSGPNVIPLRHDTDVVPALAGNQPPARVSILDLSTEDHSFSTYLRDINARFSPCQNR